MESCRECAPGAHFSLNNLLSEGNKICHLLDVLFSVILVTENVALKAQHCQSHGQGLIPWEHLY